LSEPDNVANRMVSPSSSDAESGKFHKDLVSCVCLIRYYEIRQLIITKRRIVWKCGICCGRSFCSSLRLSFCDTCELSKWL